MLIEKPTQEELEDLPYFKRLIEYSCELCDESSFDIIKKTEVKRKKKCPHCKKQGLSPVVETPTLFVKAPIVTVGQLADKNTKKMGQYELQEKRHAEKNKYKKELADYTGNEYSDLDSAKHSAFGTDTAKKKKVHNLSGDDKMRYLRGEIDV